LKAQLTGLKTPLSSRPPRHGAPIFWRIFLLPITLTMPNDRPLIVNADQIVTIHPTPDTESKSTVTFTTGETQSFLEDESRILGEIREAEHQRAIARSSAE